MKHKLFIFLLFLLSTNSFAQSKEIRFLIDTSIALMKEYSIMTDSVNWIDMKKQMLERTHGLNDSADLQNAMDFLYRSLNDPHGNFRYKGKRFGWFPKMPPVDASLGKEFDKGDLVKIQMLPNKMGYLRIPSMSNAVRDSLVRHLNDSLCYLLAQHIKGLVIDLRVNGGGSMWPMVLGVQQILGDGVVCSMLASHESLNVSIKSNAIYIDTAKKLSLKPACFTDATKLPVVLITSFETASSGEALLTSFIGRPNTTVLGVPTQSLTTGLGRHKINDYAEIAIAGTYMKDRNGKVYKTAIQPDIYMDTVNKMNDIPHDEKVLAAVKWLTKQQLF